MVGDGLGKHSFSSAGGTIEQDSTRRVDTNLGVELRISERKLNSLADLLLLDVKTSDIGVRDIWLLSHFHHLDSCISIRWQDINN